MTTIGQDTSTVPVSLWAAGADASSREGAGPFARSGVSGFSANFGVVPAVCLIVALIWATLAMVFTFVGYVESDDLAYASSASGWLTSGPYLGPNHWAIRHCIVLPMALAFKLFGESEATLVLPSLPYAVLLLVLLGGIAARLGGCCGDGSGRSLSLCRCSGRTWRLILARPLGRWPASAGWSLRRKPIRG